MKYKQQKIAHSSTNKSTHKAKYRIIIPRLLDLTHFYEDRAGQGRSTNILMPVGPVEFLVTSHVA